MPKLHRVAVLSFAIALPGTVALAQWSDSPATNLALGDGAGDQVQALIAPTADGGCYVSWFDNGTGGYDVRLQRLDAEGNELWAHGGVLVADRSFSSTQSYGLDIDGAGHALLAYRDDRSGSVRIGAQRVSPTGVLEWGANGVQLANGIDFVASPKIAHTTDSHVFVAWSNESELHLQRLDSSGTPAGALVSESIGAVSDMRSSDAGAVIVSWIHSPLFTSPKHLYAQKYGPASTPLWGAAPVIVFDGGSLQLGNFPPFVTDGSGGAVFSWYDTSSGLQCFAQRILASGAEHFGHDGVPLSTNVTRVRAGPSAAFDPITKETFAFWTELSPNQAMRGLYAQKLSATGVRQWTDDGLEVVPLGSTDIFFVRTLSTGDGAMGSYLEELSFGDARVRATRVDPSGAAAWSPAIVDVSTRPTGKGRLQAALTSTGMGVLAWKDGDFGSGDIYAQNINPDGSLGSPACPPDLAEPFGTLDFFDVLAFLSLFDAMDPAADFAEPFGVWDFFDVLAFLSLFDAGCP